MSSAIQPRSPAVAPVVRSRSLPAVVLPSSRERRRGSALVSAILHVLIIALLLTPASLHTGEVTERAQGAGGAGPAGGGGGGHLGSGGARSSREHLQYIQVAPQPVVQPTPTPVPVIEQPKPVVVPPPEPVKVQEPTPEVKPDIKVEPAKVADIAVAAPGTGGGSGRDGTAGNGPGSGGGVGSGTGTGRGSGVGPGTGGGSQANYPPSPTELFIPPLPMPDKVRGFHLIAEYDVDETGKIVDFKFTPTRDNGYNKRLEEVLKSFRFRPGTTPDGTPIRMKAQIIYDF